MGVKGLWQVLKDLNCSQVCSHDSLAGKVIAVDVSIWLYHFLKVHPERQDLVIAGLFGRIGRLLAWGVKPIFVFDGGVPELKKRVIEERRSGRDRGEREYQRLARKLLKQKLLLGDDQTTKRQANVIDVSPPIDWITQLEEPDESFYSSSEVEEEDYSIDLEDIDIYSPEFRKLPFALQEQVILGSRKRARVDLESTINISNNSADSNISDTALSSPTITNTIAHTTTPCDALEFSKAQVEALVKRHQLMQDLESLRGGKRQLLVQDKKELIEVGRVASNSRSKYLFVKSAQGAGWTLSLGDGECEIERESQKEKEKEKEETDDDEFLAMMFGSETRESEPIERVVDNEKTITRVVVEETEPCEKAVDTQLVMRVGHSEPVVVKERTKDITIKESTPIETEITVLDEETSLAKEAVEDAEKATISCEEISSDDEFSLDIPSKRLPEYVLSGLTDKKTLVNETTIKQQPIEQTPLANSHSSYAELVDSIKNEIKELDAERMAALTAAATPSKALLDAFMELIYLFGLPFLVAPFEAEAQCAAIEGIDGILSEDSDCFLFGAGVVYRGFFGGAKKGESLMKFEANLKRELLIVLACLLGSDYCGGVPGMGPKRAVQLVKLLQQEEACDHPIVDYIKSNISTDPTHKFHKLCPVEAFDERVFEAFLRPVVKPAKVDDFKWNQARIGDLETFMTVNAKWPRERTLQHLQDLQKRGLSRI